MIKNIYIDESGSMTTKFCNNGDGNRFFVVSILIPKNKAKVKRLYKRFVSSNMMELKNSDSSHSKMFKDNNFIELKGSAMSPNLKRKFVNFFAQGDLFEWFVIKVDNRYIEEKLYNNTARAFNYILKLSLEYYMNRGLISTVNELFIHIDERNEKTGSRNSLEDYLYTELVFDKDFCKRVVVNYYDSSNNHIIQLADVFGNIFYSNLMTNGYNEEILLLENEGYLKNVFSFPLNSK